MTIDCRAFIAGSFSFAAVTLLGGRFERQRRVFPFAGQAGAIAFTGDWNGDGKTKVAYYLNGFWVLDYIGNGLSERLRVRVVPDDSR